MTPRLPARDFTSESSGPCPLRCGQSTGRATVVKLSSQLRMLKGNKDERGALLEILGVASILRTPGHPSYRTSFVADVDRDLPSHHHVETAYPACWWRGKDGVEEATLAQALPLLAS